MELSSLNSWFWSKSWQFPLHTTLAVTRPHSFATVIKATVFSPLKTKGVNKRNISPSCRWLFLYPRSPRRWALLIGCHLKPRAMTFGSIDRFNVSKCWEIRSRHNHCLEFNCYRESLVETVVNFWNSQTDWGSIYNMSRRHPRGLCRVMNKCRQNIVQVSHMMHWQTGHFDFCYIMLQCRNWLYQAIDCI